MALLTESYAIDKTAVLNKIVGTLLPPGTYLQMRLPSYKNLLPSSALFPASAFHNDAVLENPTRTAAPGRSGHKQRLMEQLVTQAPCSAAGRELITARGTGHNVYCGGWGPIRRFSEHQLPPSATTIVIGTREGRPRRRWDGGKISR